MLFPFCHQPLVLHCVNLHHKPLVLLPGDLPSRYHAAAASCRPLSEERQQRDTGTGQRGLLRRLLPGVKHLPSQ